MEFCDCDFENLTKRMKMDKILMIIIVLALISYFIFGVAPSEIGRNMRKNGLKHYISEIWEGQKE
jgi:hypothetical protein